MRILITLLVILALTLPLLTACTSDDDTPTLPPQTTATVSAEPTLEPTAMPTESPAITPEQTAEPTASATLSFYRNPDYPEGYRNPISHLPVPQHPFMAPNGRSNTHNDAYMTDTYEVDGPFGINPEVTAWSSENGLATCTTFAFDTRDRILTMSASLSENNLLMLDPETLEVLATYPLPPRDPEDPLFPFGDTSGATYFLLDNQDRVLLTDYENFIQIIKYTDDEGEFQQVKSYDLSTHIVPMEFPARDHLQMTLPDWEGNLLWFMTRYGIVGTLDPETGAVHTIELTGEELQNSFAVGEDGVYMISDYAMYRFNADETGKPVIDWRFEYDRGTRIKPSNFNQGSGTSPQLFGDMVAISDNAEPRMNIIFLRRSDGSEVCRIPVFEEDRSTTENALPGLARDGANGTEYSIIVDNNYGLVREDILNPGGCWKDHVGSLARIDLIPDGSGGYTCEEIWESPEKSSQILPKLSLTNGLLYVYTYEFLSNGYYGWYLTTMDFETGETIFSIPTGIGLGFANFGPPQFIGPDGSVYFGSMQGFVRVRDGVK